MKSGGAMNVAMVRPQTGEDLVLQLRHVAEKVEQGMIDPGSVLLMVDEPEGTVLCSMRIKQLIVRASDIALRFSIAMWMPEPAPLFHKLSRYGTDNPNLILEG